MKRIISCRADNALCNMLVNEQPNLSYADAWPMITPAIIAGYSSEQILAVPNIGKVSLKEIIAWLDMHGLTLADNPHEKHKPRCPHCGQIIRGKYN